MDAKLPDTAVAEMLLDLHRHARTILIVVTHSVELARRLPRQLEMLDGRLANWDLPNDAIRSGDRP